MLLAFSMESHYFVANRTEAHWRRGKVLMREIFQWLIEADRFLGPPRS